MQCHSPSFKSNTWTVQATETSQQQPPPVPVSMSGYLDTLVTGASGHSPAVEVVGDIVDEVFVISGDLLRGVHFHTAS